jgi:DNA-binding transcriptional ArsR family regulator
MSSIARRSSPADERLDRVFHALADRTRRALMARLRQGPAAVTALAAPFAMSLPAVSKHLKVLEGAGLITRAIDGRVHRCALGAGPLADADQWLAHYRSFWENTLAALDRHVSKTPATSTGRANRRRPARGRA